MFCLLLWLYHLKQCKAWDSNVWHLLFLCCPQDLLLCHKSKSACSDMICFWEDCPGCYSPLWSFSNFFFLHELNFLFGISSVFHNFSKKKKVIANSSKITSASPLSILDQISSNDPFMKWFSLSKIWICSFLILPWVVTLPWPRLMH